MSDISDFILNTGRTLAQMALYATDHPSVKGAIVESHALLTRILTQSSELVLSTHEGKLLVNGKIFEDAAEGSIRPFIALLTKFDLHSLSFHPGISHKEMIPFFRLASRGEIRKTDQSLSEALEAQGVTHIAFNQAVYAKIREDEVVGGKEEAVSQEDGNVWEQMGGKTLNEILMLLIGRAVTDPSQREKVFNHVFGMVKEEIESAVKRVTEEFSREKTRLTNERDRTEEVVGQISDGIVVVDETGRVLMMNPSAERLYGVSLGECLGKPLWEKAKEEQMVALARDLATPTDRPLVKEVRIHASDEAQRVLRASSATVQDINGRMVGMVSVFSDVTKQKELARLQNEFLANVTHELRSPLHAIKLAMGAMLEGSVGKLNKDQDKMIILVNRNVDRLSRFIDDLLDFSKFEAGKMEIHPTQLDLGLIIKEALASLDSWAKRANIRLELEKSEKIPLVFADGDRVLQIIVNLLSNALKFTPAGGRVTVRAKTMGESEKRMAYVEVEDTGSGISEKDQERIFQKFVQVGKPSSNETRGTGLGLSICKALVELHKGSLTIQSPPPHQSHGSLFSFSLPAPVSFDRQIPEVKKKVSLPEKVKGKPFWKKLFRGFGVLILVLPIFSCMYHARPRWGTVHRVLSGSIVELEDGSRVRYLGVDTPAMGTAHYADSLSANRRMVEKKEVQLRYGVQDRDQEGAWLAYVYLNGQFVNEELVRDGLAIVAGISNDEENLGTLLKAEEKAKENRRGIWKDTIIDPYPVRMQRESGFPWASLEELKRGKKTNSKENNSDEQ